MSRALPTREYACLRHLDEAEGGVDFADLAEATGLALALVSAACQMLAERKWIDVEENRVTEPKLTDSGRAAAEEGTAERRLRDLLVEKGPVPMPEIHKLAASAGIDGGLAVRWVMRRKWVSKEKQEGGPDLLVLTDAGRAAGETLAPDESALRRLAHGEMRYLEDLAAEGVDIDALIKDLRSRKEYVKLKARTLRTATLTDEGRAVIEAGIRETEEVTALTPELLASGRWKDVTFKEFDVTLPAETRHPGKAHPLARVIQETREAFLSMGFTEARTNFVESGFWDFDALFQPQDHPAREMQDTFYLSRPGRLPLPEDEALVDRVRRTHEDGGDTGSTGWGYTWSAEKAQQSILRTHTTATTIRSLAADPNPPGKVFTIGKVFRRETISFKHLPEFHQIDGIIIDEGATLATLKGTLTEYYRQLGFPKIKFKPSFFPYTEPSAEIYVFLEDRDQWVEMGGSGIFRPEVTRPLGCEHPVLAWGLGLERLALVRFGATSIRSLYDADMTWLREVSQCQ